MLCRRTATNAGFTLMEVVAALFVMSSICVGVSSGLVYGARLSEDSRMRAAALLAAQRQMEQLRSAALADINQLPPWNNQSFNPYVGGGVLAQNQCWGLVTVTQVNADPNLLQITVTLSWRDGSGRLFGTDNLGNVGGPGVTLTTRFAARQ